MLSETQAIEIKTEIVPLTLQIAKHYDRMETLEGDRDPDTPRGRNRIAWLYDLLRNGLFHSPAWSDVVVMMKGKTKQKKYRVDGGHSSRMLVQAGADFPENMNVTLRHFRAKNIEEAMELYEQFNPKMSTRTTSDLVKNRKGYLPELANICSTNISVIARGIGFHLKSHNPREEYETLDLIRPYSKFIAWCGEFASCRKLRRPGVIGACFHTYIRDQEKALQFWRMVRDESGTRPDCPTRTLGKFLMECVFTKGQQKNTNVKWTQKAFYVKCHHAWNAWINEDTTNLKYHEGSPLPDLL